MNEAVVGNDVIDLGEPLNARAHLRARVVRRVCTDREQAELERAQDACALFWSIFAAKEAAYKVLVKLGESPGLAYRRFEVAPDLKSVGWGTHRLGLAVTRQPGLVHALATLGDVGNATFAIEPLPPGAAPSRIARQLVARLGEKSTGLDASELDVIRPELEESWDGFGPPELWHAGRRLPIDVSLSHDGNWVGAACMPVHDYVCEAP